VAVRITATGRLRRLLRQAPLTVLIMALLVALPSMVDCGARAAGASVPGKQRVAWLDQSVTFAAGGLTIYATFRHPRSGPSVPGVLLIAGSGPTDRNGNNANVPGTIGNLKALADWLSADNVASLRYDKLGSGKTGLGPYASNPDAIGIAPYEEEAASALRFLAGQTGIESSRLGVIGHSEGALFALLLATGHAGEVPPVHALGLLEPLSQQYLTLVTEQFDAKIATERSANKVSAAGASRAKATLASTIAQLRVTGTVPGYPPYGIGEFLNPTTATFFSQTDRFDPATLAAELPRQMPVLVSCSNADTVISCAEVADLEHGLNQAHTDVDAIHLHDADHVLKVDPTGSPDHFALSLPFSPQLKAALAAFVRRNL
jgi:pimeloyl-ACP methyl ester carboxylesterase